jgi:hypothetical protein
MKTIPFPARCRSGRLGRAGLAWCLGVAGLHAKPLPAAGPAAPSVPAVVSPIDTLDQAALQETFRLLRTNYIQRDALTLESLNRAALEGLLARLDFGAEIVPLATTPAAPAPAAETQAPTVVSESLANGIVYLRPAAFTLEAVPACEAALKALPADAAATLILDLRTPGPPAEFAAAAGLLNLFIPAGQPLFSVQKTDDPAPRHFRSAGTPGWTGRLMVLIDSDCTNAAETVAAVLHRTLQAPLIGAPTRGRTMQYETAPLTPSHGLRFASAEMRLPDGTSLFRKGLEPALSVPTDPAIKNTVFARHAEHGVKPSITHPERPRHNEAALVAGTAPELPHQLAQSAGQPTPHDTPPLQDRTLQVAVDVLTARQAVR